jgi:hypothetical protein
MPRDIPIIFSAPMVRALIDGRKTMTRRLALSSRKLKEESGPGFYRSSTKIIKSPWQRVQPGDRLWVRESYRPSDMQPDDWGSIIYRADVDPKSVGPWKASLYLPRFGSRLTLVVTETKIERLNDISLGDIRDEGCRALKSAWAEVWDSIHGPGAYMQNPLVVAIRFRVTQANIDAMENEGVA